MRMAVAQTGQSAKPTHPSAAAAWKHYCQPNGGFCFNYPPSWQMMGEIYDGNGVVIAPPQKDDPTLWDEITVAHGCTAERHDGGTGSGWHHPAGRQRACARADKLSRPCDGSSAPSIKPAQMLKAQYQDKSTGHDWIEELVFIQGPDNEIYSVALKCTSRKSSAPGAGVHGVLRSGSYPSLSLQRRPDELLLPADCLRRIRRS